MDANGETIAAKEDAYVHEGIKSPASKLSNDLGLDELPKANDEKRTDSQSADKEEDCDDLLEKIEEAVKDEVAATTVENDISKSSQQDFLKKIEEIENDSTEESQATETLPEREITDKVVVGKLVIDIGCNEPKSSSDHVSEKQEETKEVLGNKMEEAEPSPAGDAEENIAPNSKEDTTDKALIEESELELSESKQETEQVKSDESTTKMPEVQNDVRDKEVKDLEKEIPTSSSNLEEVTDSIPIEDSQEDKLEEKSEVAEEKTENKDDKKVTLGNTRKISSAEENLTILIEDSSEDKTVEASEEPQKEQEITVDLTEIGSSEKANAKDEDKKISCVESEKEDDDKDVIEIDSTEKEKVHSDTKKETESKSVKEDAMSVDIINIPDEPMEVDSENKTEMEVDNIETISDQDEEMVEIQERDEIVISSDSENENSKAADITQKGKSVEPENSCQKDAVSSKTPCSTSVKPPEEKGTQSKVSTTKNEEATVEPIEKTTPPQEKASSEIQTVLTETEQSKNKEKSEQSVEKEPLSSTKEGDDKNVAESLPEEPPNQQKVTEQRSPSVDTSTTEEISSPKKDNQKVECKLDEAPKKSPSTTTDETRNEKQQNHLSDSTASLSSNTEEQMEQFGKETTIPAVEITSKIENKLLMNIKQHEDSSASLNTTPVTTLNVFNSTPIQKQFEISSENVSKISEAAESSRTEKIIEEEAAALKMPLNTSKPEETSETGTCTTSETEQQSSDGVAKYINVIKKYNGITDTTDDESTSDIKNRKGFGIFLNDAPDKNAKKDNVYEINLWYESHDIKFLSVERLDLKKAHTHLHDKTSEYSEQGSSNGSVGSLPPFTLPASRLSEMSSSVSSSTISQKTIDDKLSSQAQTRKSKHTIQGISDLCTFMIQEFTKIKKSLETTETSSTPSATNKEDPTTPKTFHKELAKKNLNKGKSESPSVSDASSTPVKTDKRVRKRSLNKSLSDDEDDSGKSKSKKLKKIPVKPQGTPSKEIEETESNVGGQCVLAKWVDKKYYAGRITGQKPGNKFVVLFADGASKTLPKESIVFGDEHSLPLKSHTIHALVDDDYECGIVTSVDRVDDKTIYVVKAETKTVKITAADIYLQEDQAKAIQNTKVAQKNIPAATVEEDITSETAAGSARSKRNKRAPASPVTPEPGFSGGVGKRSGKKQKSAKVVMPLNRISESSDLSDTQDPTSVSPDRGLETVEGVQPETQRTAKEIEISRCLSIADLTKENPNFNAQDVLGPSPILKNLFKNKYFLLTCTIGVKPHRYVQIDASNVNNRDRQFSKVPFVKSLLQKQLEEGGGKVYQHFEDIPKTKYKQCKLIAPRPCVTAKYVQCLAADIQAISHEWVIDSCKLNSLADIKMYILPSGWSMLYKKYIRWAAGKASDQRQSKVPFGKVYILIASQQKEFSEFWSRVCKLAGGTIRYITSLNDVTPSTKGYMVADSDLPQAIRSKAEHFGIPIVSTVWVVQSLILGKICIPSDHRGLCQAFQDDDL